jgi:hypothetical protein
VPGEHRLGGRIGLDREGGVAMKLEDASAAQLAIAEGH